MKKFIILLFIPLVGYSQVRVDHKLHFLAGSTVGASVLHLPTMDQYTDIQKVYIGTLAATFVGVGGEVVDIFRPNSAVEGSDVLWTALGGLVSSAINVYVIKKIGRNDKRRSRKNFKKPQQMEAWGRDGSNETKNSR
jgi:VanZ family protein